MILEMPSIRISSYVEISTYRFHRAQRPEWAFGNAFVGVPHIVARQVDVVPAKWSDVQDQVFVNLVLLQ